ncbi:hypothetical protein KSP40_PGU022527 [Platanthera guangdongensis]|uniref:Uncharacterized protein n=1 Tax=Platanthera guangdongensis TaxID=2320717 RepID=A0ABR2LL64_9ASPA
MVLVVIYLDFLLSQFHLYCLLTKLKLVYCFKNIFEPHMEPVQSVKCVWCSEESCTVLPSS